MLRRLIHSRRRRKEQGAVSLEFIFAFPLLMGAIFAMMDISLYFHHQGKVQHITREVVRGIAADGGVSNPRTKVDGQKNWEVRLRAELVKDGKCVKGFCKPGEVPWVDCDGTSKTVKVRNKTGVIRGGYTDSTNDRVYTGNVVKRSGDFVTCVVHYPYAGVAGAIINGPFGMGLGSILGEYIVEETGRAETGGGS